MNTNKKNIILGAGILIAGILLGWLFFGSSFEELDVDELHDHALEQEQVWTCSMHPQIRQSEPGDCPICGMDLIPMNLDDNSLEPDMFRLSANAIKLANISTMTVGTGEASKELRLNGKVMVDERSTYTQSTHIPGRIEQLKVNFTGEEVNRGQTLAIVYSPALVTAQEELLQAQEIKESQPELFAAAKQKLRNWKIGDAQIERMLTRGEPIDRFPITADVGGVVTELMAEQGDYLERGMPVYQIANLDKLWILFDLYESDLNWVQEGSTITYTVQSIPGKTFEAEIDFIDPLLNNSTRVATARIEVPNEESRLKPGMFVTGIIENDISGAKTQEMVIPKSAVLWTGERSVVYIKEETGNGSAFKMREITLGPGLGDSYVVQEGLQEGEQLVVNGTFTVDAAAQLQGKRSMMNQAEENISENVMTMELSEPFQSEFQKVLDSYFSLKDALVASDAEKTSEIASELLQKTKNLDAVGSSEMLSAHLEKINEMLEAISENDSLENQRDHFRILSQQMMMIAENVENLEETIYVQHCPMADNNHGADWLSLSSEVRNPYYGEDMLTCGEVIGQIK